MTKIGFVGVGGISAKHLEQLALMERVEVTAFCDLQLERAEKEALKWPGAKAYGSLAYMLDDQRLDAVYVCVPPMAHGDAEHALIERGIPFYVEKPLSNDGETALRIADKVRKAGLVTAVGYHWRYRDTVVKARKLLAGKEVAMATGYWMGGRPSMPWWGQQHLSGGQFVEQTTHIVDLLRYLVSEVEEVHAAFARRSVHKRDESFTAHDTGCVTMRLANGAVASISNNCLSPVLQAGIHLYTDSFTLELRHTGLTLLGPDGPETFKETSNPYGNADAAFIQAVRTGDPSSILCDYEEGLATLAVTLAANRSAESGTVQPVRESRNESVGTA